MAGIAVCLPVELFAARVPPWEFLFLLAGAMVSQCGVRTRGSEYTRE